MNDAEHTPREEDDAEGETTAEGGTEQYGGDADAEGASRPDDIEADEDRDKAEG